MKIPIQKVSEAALEIMKRAAIEIPVDYKNGIKENGTYFGLHA
ncbi:hypothetical protein [Variovorax sp. WS11]|nr:hypothetical protein [Variovorax sp. WS11]